MSNIRTELIALHTDYDQLLKNKEDLEKKFQLVEVSHKQAIADRKQQNSFVLEQCHQQSQLELEKTVLNIKRKYQEQIQN